MAMHEFTIYGRNFEIEEEKVVYFSSYSAFSKISQNVADDIAAYYKSKCRNAKGIIEKLPSYKSEQYAKAAAQAASVFVNNGIYTYDDSQIMKEAFVETEFDKWFSAIKEEYEQHLKDDVNARKEAATTSIFSANTGLAYRIGKKEAKKARKEVKQLYKSDETKFELRAAITSDIMRIFALFLNVMVEEGREEFSQIPFSTIQKCKSLCNNLNKGIIPSEKVLDVWFEALKSNPAEQELYYYALASFDNPIEELTPISELLNIDLFDTAERLIADIADISSIGTEEEAVAAKEEISELLERLSITHSPTIDQLNSIIENHGVNNEASFTSALSNIGKSGNIKNDLTNVTTGLGNAAAKMGEKLKGGQLGSIVSEGKDRLGKSFGKFFKK